MEGRRLLVSLLAVALVAVSCGGDGGDDAAAEGAETTSAPPPAATQSSDSTVRAPERSTSDDTMPVPEGFPAPFMGGGGFLFEADDEIRMAYAPEDYDLIIDFYQKWSLGQSHRLIDNAPDYTWDFPDFTITLEVDNTVGNIVTIKRDGS